MGWAFLTWLLYYVGFYVIGLIANIVLLGNAGAEKRRTGGAPAGMGCLWILLIVHLILPIVLLVLFLTGGLAGLTSALESGTW